MISIMKHCLFLFSFLFFFLLPLPNTLAAEYAGVEACIDCHQEQYKAWKGSHHERSMLHANEDSVLGDFNNQILEEEGKKNKFFRKGKEYWVNIKGPDQQHHDYQIKYTFAYEPLQQYMVEFDDGRVQLIPFAWDSRSKAEGGQRWFNLYPQFDKSHQEYFWTNTGQNWNYMCADCHSTNLKKNFDVEKNQYKTTYSEINVACEACHGPASDHISWTKKIKRSNSSTPNIEANKVKSDYGFNRNLAKSVPNWITRKGKNTLFADEINPSQQTLVCAQCHSRHLQISDDDHVESGDFSDRHLLNLLTPNMYYPDGQIYDEVFVYGSFMQSKMQENGVVCSNCHDPHTADLIMPEEVVCLQCHQAPTYASKSHHQHQENGAGAQCVNCHMPEENYMAVDDRRDHAWHSPNPTLAKKLGSPDTCLSCHENKDSSWSESFTKRWYPKTSEQLKELHFGEVFSAADANYQGAATELSKIAQTNSNPTILKAAALARMENIPDTNTMIAIARSAKSPESLVRLGAINGAKGLGVPERWRILSPLLNDKVLAVRTEAAFALAPDWQAINKDQKALLQPTLDEFLKVQQFNADRGFSHTNTGNVYAHQQRYKEAEEAYQTSMAIEPYFATAYLNMAELFRLQNKEKQAIETLITAAKLIPDNGRIQFALALTYIRNKDTINANKALLLATQFNSNNAHYFYVYGLSLEKVDLNKAYKSLHQAYQLSQNPQHLYALCDMQVRHNAWQARQCITQMKGVIPENAIKQLQQQLKQ